MTALVNVFYPYTRGWSLVADELRRWKMKVEIELDVTHVHTWSEIVEEKRVLGVELGRTRFGYRRRREVRGNCHWQRKG